MSRNLASSKSVNAFLKQNDLLGARTAPAFSRSRRAGHQHRLQSRIGQDNAAGEDTQASQKNIGRAALVGDLATENDAVRLKRSGAPVKQITTGTICHLDASMVSSALEGWDLNDLDILFIENVGNLVCPSSYDLGEDFASCSSPQRKAKTNR